MACHGIPVVTAGTGRYSGLGFTIDSATPAEYIDRLRRLEMLPPMAERQIELARRFAHALFEKRPWKMRSFEMVRLPIEKIGHPLDHNIVPHVKDHAELVHAEDMLELANWIASGQTDYLQPDVFSLTPASLKCVE